jgi:hypothetical protein
MLFPRNALTSGPQACFLAGKRIAKVKVGKPGILFDTEEGIFYTYSKYTQDKAHQKGRKEYVKDETYHAAGNATSDYPGRHGSVQQQ